MPTARANWARVKGPEAIFTPRQSQCRPNWAEAMVVVAISLVVKGQLEAGCRRCHSRRSGMGRRRVRHGLHPGRPSPFRRRTGSPPEAQETREMNMNRRDMLKAGLAVGALGLAPRLASATTPDFAPLPKGWRSF